MRSDTFDYINTAIFNLEEVLGDETLSGVEEAEVKKCLNILEDLIEED